MSGRTSPRRPAREREKERHRKSDSGEGAVAGAVNGGLEEGGPTPTCPNVSSPRRATAFDTLHLLLATRRGRRTPKICSAPPAEDLLRAAGVLGPGVQGRQFSDPPGSGGNPYSHIRIPCAEEKPARAHMELSVFGFSVSGPFTRRRQMRKAIVQSIGRSGGHCRRGSSFDPARRGIALRWWLALMEEEESN